MTERERALAILHHQVPDQLPWYADFDYYIHYLRESGLYPKEYENSYYDDGLQKMHRDYGTGFYLQGYQPWNEIPHGWEMKVEESGDDQITTWTTPVGQLVQKARYSHISYSHGITKHAVEDIDDLKIYLWIVQHTEYTPNYDYAIHRAETVGDNGLVLVYTPKSPLMNLVAIMAGVENVTYMIMDEEEEFNAILAQLEEKFDEAAAIAVACPSDVVMIPENISSECVVPFYQQYMKPYHQKWTARIREAGKFSYVHQDGTTRGLVTQLSKESHFDVIEAVTPYPVGDVDIEEVGEMVNPETIIWGGIPGGLFNEVSCTDEEFEAHVIRCIQVMTKHPHYVLGVADQVVPCSSERRIKRVRELVEQYGKY